MAKTAEQISFGPFRLAIEKKMLMRGDAVVRLGSRALEILIALVEQAGRTIGKEELISRVWPDSFVEEGNLKVNVAALRKALGDGKDGRRYIVTVPGRGYCFVASITRAEDGGTIAPAPVSAERSRSLPAPLARMVGRDETVNALVAQLPKRRFITIVGPGGIGKTTVALAVADSLAGAFKDGIYFLDLAPIADASLVPSALATALSLPGQVGNSTQSLVASLKDKRALVLFDSCEHVVEAVADLADGIYRGAPEVHILTTSREPLRVEGERVHRLAPLQSPPQYDRLMAAEALSYPAVQLFAERAAAGSDKFELNDSEAPVVADICRRLDGIALAIEIVAGRADAFGVHGIAEQLDDRFRLMMRGRRTALSRHQTLAATFEWSYALLSNKERIIFRRLSLFAGNFTIDSAVAVLEGAEITASDVVDGVASLIAKSLLSAALDDRFALYRLLDTTRAYGLSKLTQTGERDQLAARHAEHFCDLLERAGVEWRRRPAVEWRETHQHLIDNVRTALDWAFSQSGDRALGVALTLAAVPLWFASSQTKECYERVKTALAAVSSFRDDAQAMGLQAALAWSLMQTRGSVPETREAWMAVLRIAETLDDADFRLRAIWGLWAGLLNNSDLTGALRLAEAFAELAAKARPEDGPVGDRMIGYIVHLMGDQSRARVHIERMLEHYKEPLVGAQIIRFVFDQRSISRCFLARILWLQGFADQAIELVDDIIATAVEGGNPLSLCQGLVQAGCPLALHVGDFGRFRRYVDLLLEQSAKNALEFWSVWGRCFEGVLFVRRGDLAAGLAKLGAGLEALRAIQYGVYYIVFLGEYAEALGRAGRVADGLATIGSAIERCEQNQEKWYFAELLRIEGELLHLKGEATEAEARFERARDVAQSQRTLAWELRVAVSQAQIWLGAGRVVEARALVAPVLDRFSEGSATADFRAAKALIERAG